MSESSRKRPRSPTGGEAAAKPARRARKSRFAPATTAPAPTRTPRSKAEIAAAAAAAVAKSLATAKAQAAAAAAAQTAAARSVSAKNAASIAQAAADALAKAQRNQKIQAALASIQNAKLLAGSTGVAPTGKLVLDNLGRQVDQSGRVLGFQAVATLAANRSNAKSRRRSAILNPYMSGMGAGASATGANAAPPGISDGSGADNGDKDDAAPADANAPFDPRMAGGNRPGGRRRAGLKFAEQGKFIKQAASQRAREAREAAIELAHGPGSRHAPRVHAELDGAAAATGNANLVAVGRRRDALPSKPSTRTPAVEWWDIEFLPAEVRKERKEAVKAKAKPPAISYDQCAPEHCVTLSSGLIELPVPVAPINQDNGPTAVPLMLTKKERKRLRRQTRAERLKEQQDKVALRLIPPPAPKVKLKNMMLVRGNDAVMDPTQVEAQVRAEMEKRQRNHEMRNLARKLTPAERKAKKRTQLTATSGAGVEVAVFRVKDLTNKQHMYKVDVNAQQLYLTGCVLFCQEANLNLVVVEGGLKGVKKFVKLMTRRIDWSAKPGGEEDSSDSEEDDAAQKRSDNFCHMVWRGVAPRKGFNNFRFEECKTSKAARAFMKGKGLAQYWDMVETGAPVAAGARPPVMLTGSSAAE